MKLLVKLFLVISLFSFINSCKDNATNPTASGFKGYIYYSTGTGGTSRVNVSTQIIENLIFNTRFPDITANGEILAIEPIPLRLIITDLTGANRKLILEGSGNNDPIHRKWMYYPRISYNQKYIAYCGGINARVTYVIDAITGDLVATIGNENTYQPMYRPSWAPDGSLYLMGYNNSQNNGIYKVSSDFKTITRVDDPKFTNVAYPSVSPDGKSIAFIRDFKLWTMGIDGTNPKQLYVEGLTFYIPTWSPDSKYIAAVSSGSGAFAYIFDLANNTFTKLKTIEGLDINDQLCWVY